MRGVCGTGSMSTDLCKTNKNNSPSHRMEKSGDVTGFKRPTTYQHISFILGVRVAAEWLSAASTLYPPTLGSVQKSQHRFVSLGLCGPCAVPARLWCVPWRCRFDGPAQAPGPPASRRKRTGWSTRGKCGYSDQKKEGGGATLAYGRSAAHCSGTCV